MTKEKLIAEIAEATGVKKVDVNAVLNSLSDNILKEVRDGGDSVPLNIGMFKQKKNDARMGRNPATGEQIKIKASTTIMFRPSANVKLVK